MLDARKRKYGRIILLYSASLWVEVSPRGCIAQAWSVAELIRAYQLINS